MIRPAQKQEPGRVRTFLDNYRAVVMLSALLLLSIFGVAQTHDTAQRRQDINAYGYAWKNVEARETFRLPQDSPKLRVADSGSIAWKNGCLIYWSGHKWKVLVCGAAPLTIITHPASQTVNTGDNVTFTVAATGGITPYTYQWFVNSSIISGATSSSYTQGGVLFSDSGNQYIAAVYDSGNDTAYSNRAILSVNAGAPITVTYGYSASDPYVDNSTAPTIGSSATTTITHNADLSISFPFAAVDKFLVFKVPSGESTKIHWFVTSLNNGDIPDAAFRAPFTVGSFTYYVTRDAAGFTFDYTQPVQLKL